MVEEITPEQWDVLIPLLVHEGYLEETTLPNGKKWYKRTNKQLPKTGDMV